MLFTLKKNKPLAMSYVEWEGIDVTYSSGTKTTWKAQKRPLKTTFGSLKKKISRKPRKQSKIRACRRYDLLGAFLSAFWCILFIFCMIVFFVRLLCFSILYDFFLLCLLLKCFVFLWETFWYATVWFSVRLLYILHIRLFSFSAWLFVLGG